MIPNQWYAVLESKEIPTGRAVGVTRMGEKMVFWRDERGQLACLSDRCPHRGVALSLGKVVEGTLECPFHGFRYDATGTCRLVPANGRAAPLPRQIRASCIPVDELDGFVFIWWGQSDRNLPPLRYFDDLEGLTYASARDPWKAHYSRVIENQLDVAHLPFVHSNTIGRGARTLVDGPWVEWLDPGRFRLYVSNRLDDGSLPRRSSELPKPDNPFHLEFVYPNLWQNHINENVRVVAAFVPVDEENTLLYLRFYQGFLKLPLLKSLAARLAMPSNLYIAHQDRGIVESHDRGPSQLKSGEKLIPADGPIVQYRQRRQEFIDAAR